MSISVAAQKFLERNKIDLVEGKERLYETKDINILLDNYMISNDIGNKFVCIKDIYGYSYSWRMESNDLFKSFNNYFNSEGDSYHSRANGMLDYSSDEIVERLENSFIKEPIILLEVEDNKYVVETNGIHRFNVLKVSYLGEISKCKTEEEIERVNKLFTIPVKVNKIDIFKSYCNYLLNKFKKEEGRFWVSSNTNNSDLCAIEHGDEKFTLTNDELLEYVKNNIKEDAIDDEQIEWFTSQYPSFADFINLYKEKLNEGKNI